MDINNPTQFVSFIGTHKLESLHPIFQQLVICMGDYSRYCECHNQNDKIKIYNKCNILYSQAAKMSASIFKSHFLSKTTDRQIVFNSDGTFIAIASR